MRWSEAQLPDITRGLFQRDGKRELERAPRRRAASSSKIVIDSMEDVTTDALSDVILRGNVEEPACFACQLCLSFGLCLYLALKFRFICNQFCLQYIEIMYILTSEDIEAHDRNPFSIYVKSQNMEHIDCSPEVLGSPF